MFTGLIEGTGVLLRIEQHGPDSRIVIRPEYEMHQIEVGESIAVDGACLTVVSFQANTFSADVSAETLSRTTLTRKPPGKRINLERALRLGDRLGGHIMSGHVDGIGVLRERLREGRSWRLFFGIPDELSRYVVAKGSIGMNGISLTVNGCSSGRFDVNIVPHTAAQTTIAELQAGEEVNIETDVIAKYVESMLSGWSSGTDDTKQASRIDDNFLRKHGFI